MKRSLLIYGAGGLGREVLAMVKALPDWNPVGFIDDNVLPGQLIGGLPVLGGVNKVNATDEAISLVIAVGDPRTKAQVARLITNKFVSYPTIIHPSARVLDLATVILGKGCIIAAGVVLTTDISIGSHVLINLNSTVGHDSTIGNFCSVMPGVNVAGNVCIGEEVLIGAGANIRNDVTISDKVIIGMGSVVLRDIETGRTVAGVPAKSISG